MLQEEQQLRYQLNGLRISYIIIRTLDTRDKGIMREETDDVEGRGSIGSK
jgi:hypothetical protein